MEGRSKMASRSEPAFRWPRLYDWTAAVLSLGREQRIRERTLEVANVPLGADVLDIGCGTGTLALAARRRVGAGGSVHGIDPSPEMIGRARAKAAAEGLSVDFEVATADALPFPDAMFDAVFCTLTLHHIPEDRRGRALEEMRRVLEPGGRALIVEHERPRGVGALLRPMGLLHARHAGPVLEGAVGRMKRAGFERVGRGRLGVGGLEYVLGRRD